MMTVRRTLRSAAIVAAVLGLLSPHTAHAKILAQWVQLGPDGTSSVRAITEDACPAVTFDGKPVPMSVRAEPGRSFGNVKPAQFPVRGCEAMVPPDAVAAMLDGKALPLARPNPQRILVFGDTGCRLKTGDPTQSCNDINAWPFPKIAAVAAAARPDLVIYVGDYNYREDACPAGYAGCAGSPWGYGWDTWNADFFAPAAPLLAAAPWVMVRGNHEDCVRAGEGWFRFLDRLPMEPACRDFTGAFVARLGDFGVVVVDGAAADDPKGDASDMASTLRRQFIEVLAKVPAEAWLTTHRPLDAMLGSEKGTPRNFVANKVLQLALGADMPTGVRMYRLRPHPFLPGRRFRQRPPAAARGRHRRRQSRGTAAAQRDRRRHQRRQGGRLGDLFGLRLHGLGPRRQRLVGHLVRRERQAHQSLPALQPLAQLPFLSLERFHINRRKKPL